MCTALSAHMRMGGTFAIQHHCVALNSHTLTTHAVLTTNLEDAGARGLSEAQRDHPQLGQLIQPLIIRDGAHQHRDLALVLLSQDGHGFDVQCCR